MKIVLFGLHYSPNLGDGVIAECLAHGLRAALPGAEVVTIDISGRDGFGAVTVRNRALALKVLGMLPRPLRGRLVRSRLQAMLAGAEPRWREALRGADLAVIGGGQLFSDADLNFPTKIDFAARLIAEQGVPMAIHAAGVSGNWSAPGKRLFSAVFETDLRLVGLRDEGSCAAWIAQTGGRGPGPVLTRDPGLLAGGCYGAPAERHGVGICVTDPAILGYHADAEVAGARGAEALAFYAGLAVALAEAGREAVLFCNGAAEDTEALNRLAARPEMLELAAEGRLRIAEAPRTPAQLSALVGGLEGVIAHRLHACILAWAHGVPAVGLGWDRKVESFFASVGAPEFCVTTANAEPWSVAALAGEAVARGIDGAARRAAIAETQDAITRLAGLTSPAGGI